MSNKTYDILKFVALIIVPIVNFIFLVLTSLGKIDGGIATVILGGLDALRRKWSMEKKTRWTSNRRN